MTENGMTGVMRDYKVYRHSKTFFLMVFAAIFAVMAVADIGVGSYSVGVVEVFKVLINHLWDILTRNALWDLDVDPYIWKMSTVTDSVVWTQRLPRILVAIISGIGLAVAGVAMQSMLKNPLAEPYTTGISSGAAFGVTIAITLGIYLIPGNYGTVLNAFVFGLIPAGVILLLSRFKRPSPTMMILAGTSLMYIFNAMQQFFMLIADPNSSQQVLSWITGSITSSTWGDIRTMLMLVAIGSLAVQYLTKTLNAMNSGDSYAKSLGVNVNRTRVVTLLVISLITAGVVSFTGIIGFVGLVAPHIARMFIGSDNRYLVPASALMGAGLMLFADIVTHYLVNFNLPIGIVTAVIGGPVFLFLILRQKKEVW